MRIVLTIIALVSATLPALAGSITVTVAEGGQSTLTWIYTIADGDVDRIVAALQNPANVQVNGTATRTQVFQYMTSVNIANLVSAVQSYEQAKSIAAIVPNAPVSATITSGPP